MATKTSILLSVVAILTAGFAIARSENSRSDRQILHEIRSELGDLTSQMEQVGIQIQTLKAAQSLSITVPTGADGKESEALRVAFLQFTERLLALEQQLVGLRDIPPDRARALRPSEDLAHSHQLTLDQNAPAKLRANALKDLRRADRRIPEVVTAMATLLLDPGTDEATKTSVVRDLSGLKNADLKKPLLSLLEHAKDPGLKAEAVETLQSFYDDPEVMAAVLRARDNDPGGKVGREVERRLANWKAR